MGFLFRKRTAGRSDYIEVPIPAGETQVGTWTGSALAGGRPVIGVKVILTDRHLILTPLDLSQAIALFKMFAKYVQAFATPTQVVKDIIDQTGLQQVVSIPLDDIQSVEALGGPSLFRPPAIRVTLRDGTDGTIGVLKSILSPNFLPANAQYRDALLKALQAGIEPQ